MTLQKQDLITEGKMIIIDDFTNSGGTLFETGKTLRDHYDLKANNTKLTIGAYIPHLLAKYQDSVVQKLVDKLYSDEEALSAFYTSDSVPRMATLLREKEDEKKKEKGLAGEPNKAHVMTLAPIFKEWLQEHTSASLFIKDTSE